MESALRFHAVDPTATLEPGAIPAILARLRAAFTDADDIAVQRWDATQFIDNGANLDRVRCPACGADMIEEWSEMMSDAWTGDGFDDLAVATPCCSTSTSLDLLGYEWAVGYGRFSLDVAEPGVSWFVPHRPVPSDAVELLADLIQLSGHRLGIVWRHL